MPDIRKYFQDLKLEEWEFLEFLNDKGSGQGKVIAVKNTRTQQQGVFRCIINDKDSISVERFHRDLKVITDTTFKHENLINILAFPIEENQYWYISERGVEFFDYWRNVKNSTTNINELFNKALLIVRKILTGLSKLHNLDSPVIHRDIKPQNIIFVNDNPVLIDFGILYKHDYPRITKVYESTGNRKYSPSEVIYGGMFTPIPWIDVFSISQLLAWMIIEYPDEKKTWARPPAWEYIPFPPDLSEYNQKCLRAILACCYVEEIAPQNADELIKLLDNFFFNTSTEEPEIQTNSINQIVSEGKASQLIKKAKNTEIINSNFEIFKIPFEEIKNKTESIINKIVSSSNQFSYQELQHLNIHDWKDNVLADPTNQIRQFDLLRAHIVVDDRPFLEFYIGGIIHIPGKKPESMSSQLFPIENEFIFQFMLSAYQVEKYMKQGMLSFSCYINYLGDLYIQKLENGNRTDTKITVSEFLKQFTTAIHNKELWKNE